MSTATALVVVWLGAVGFWGVKYLSRLRGVQGDWNPANWRRCQNCGGRLVRLDPDHLAPHLGHRLGPARGMGTVEYVKVLVGAL